MRFTMSQRRPEPAAKVLSRFRILEETNDHLVLQEKRLAGFVAAAVLGAFGAVVGGFTLRLHRPSTELVELIVPGGMALIALALSATFLVFALRKPARIVVDTREREVRFERRRTPLRLGFEELCGVEVRTERRYRRGIVHPVVLTSLEGQAVEVDASSDIEQMIRLAARLRRLTGLPLSPTEGRERTEGEGAESGRRQTATPVLTAMLLCGSVLTVVSELQAAVLPASPCPADPGMVIQNREWSDFLWQYTTPQGHFTIYYGLQDQASWDPELTCFPPLFAKQNGKLFVANVGAVLEQVYAFYEGNYNAPALAGLGFQPPSHIDVKLYNASGSFAGANIILKVQHAYAKVDGEYRFWVRTPLHEIFHTIQHEAGAPSDDQLLNWFIEGTARYANVFLGSKDDGSGDFITGYGSTPAAAQFWDLSQTLEAGWYHYGGRFWRFLTYNWPLSGVTEADRQASTHEITLPHPVTPASTFRLKPRQGIVLLHDVLAEIATLDATGACPATDLCYRKAIDRALGGRTWSRQWGNLYDFDSAYRLYATENVRLEGPGEGSPVAARFRGKFKTEGATNPMPVDRAPVATYTFEAGDLADYTVLVTGSARSAAQNPTGSNDDDMRFELDGQSFGDWNTPAAFDGNSLEGRVATRFLRTGDLAPYGGGLPSGLHQLRIVGDQSPRRHQIRVVRGDITPVLAEERLALTSGGSPCSGFNSAGSNFTLGVGLPFFAPGLLGFVPQHDVMISAVRTPGVDHQTGYELNGSPEWYDSGTWSYRSDSPTVLKASYGAGLPTTLRSRLENVAGPNTLELCSDPKQALTSDEIDSVYVYPRPVHDVFVEIHGSLHEYSTQYEVFDLDPTASQIQVRLVGAGPGTDLFLVLFGVEPSGQKVLLTEDVLMPFATPVTGYKVTDPSSYIKLIVGVGAYGFEPYDDAHGDITLRGTIPYTLRIASGYAFEPGTAIFADGFESGDTSAW